MEFCKEKNEKRSQSGIAQSRRVLLKDPTKNRKRLKD